MRLGIAVAQDFWLHFREIYAALQERHQTQVFHQRRWPFQWFAARMNRQLLQQDLRWWMRRNDVVFFEWGEEAWVAATHLPKTCPMVVRVHSHELWDYAPQARLENVDRFIFVSQAMQRRFAERFPAVADRLVTVHNGVRLDRFSMRPRTFGGVLGVLGRIEPHKRIYDLILVLYQLRQMGYDLRLHIGGQATETRYARYDYEVHSLVSRLKLDPYVSFQGFIQDTPAWFQDIDILISHSVSEGLQVALLEGMASGVYCLAHAWDGVNEALLADNIYWTDAELIEQVKNYCDWSEMQRQAARSYLRNLAEQRFDIEKQKILVCQIIEQVMEHSR